MPAIFAPSSKSYPPYGYTVKSILAPPVEGTATDITTDSTIVYLVLVWLVAFLLIEVYLVILPRFRCKPHDVETAPKIDECHAAWEKEGFGAGRIDPDIKGGLPREFSCQCVEVEDLVCLQVEKQGIKAEDANQTPSRWPSKN